MFQRSWVVPVAVESEAALLAQMEIQGIIRAQEDMMLIYNQIIGLEEEFKMLLKAKETSQYHQQLQLDRDRRIIQDSRCNIQDLLGQLSVCDGKVNNINAENAKTLELCKRKTSEIENLRNKNAILERNNLHEFQERQRIQLSINRQKAVKMGLRDQCAELSSILEQSVCKLRIMEQEQDEVEREAVQLDKLREMAEKDSVMLQREKLEREVSSGKTTIALSQALKQRQEVKLRLEDLQNQNKLVQNQHSKVLVRLSKQAQVTSKLQAKLKASIKGVGLAEREFEQTLNVNRALNQQNIQLSKRNQVLTQTTKRHLMEVETLQLTNEDLKRQIDMFLACQDQARNILNHRVPFQALMTDNSRQLNFSGKNLHLHR